MVDTAVGTLANATVQSLRNAGLAHETIKTVKETIHSQAAMLQQPLDFLATRYKQDKHFDSHPLAVKPQSIVLGSSVDTHRGFSHIVHNTFQYVSVEQTLRSLLHNASYVEALLSDKCTPGVIKDWQDGTKFASNSIFTDPTRLTIVLQLFYDGMGTTNPLRGQAVMNNVGVFYFTVKNLPNAYNSCFANVHLLALCTSNELKQYGFDPVLRKLVDELTHLDKVGFSGDFPLIGSKQIFVRLGQVACDILAFNVIFGFIECFSADYFCTLCYAKQADIQCKFYEHEFVRRTVASYNRDLAALVTEKKSHVHGVKGPCLLNELPGYHLVNNYSLNIMHILLEGVVPVELGCVLYTLSTVRKYFTLFEFRDRVHFFWSKINVDKDNKPPELNGFDKPGRRLSPSMKAVQMWCLLRYLPLIVGDCVPHDDEHWLFLLHLSQLVDLVFAPKFTPGMVSFLRETIAEHLQLFKELYGFGEAAVSLKPKHHLLVHLPTIIMQIGPLTGMSCLRYELKNSFFKRSAHTAGNFTNVCSTLAYRHQQLSLLSKLSGEHVRKFFSVCRHERVPIFALSHTATVCDKLGLESTDDVIVAKQISRASVVYKVGQHVILDVNADGCLLFGRIEQFVSLPDASEWFTVVQKMETLNFDSHFNSFVASYVKQPEIQLVAIDDLLDYHPVCCYGKVCRDSSIFLIRPQYHVLKE